MGYNWIEWVWDGEGALLCKTSFSFRKQDGWSWAWSHWVLCLEKTNANFAIYGGPLKGEISQTISRQSDSISRWIGRQAIILWIDQALMECSSLSLFNSPQQPSTPAVFHCNFPPIWFSGNTPSFTWICIQKKNLSQKLHSCHNWLTNAQTRIEIVWRILAILERK